VTVLIFFIGWGGEEQNQSLSVYSPSLSSTYQTVTCKNPLCSSSVVQCLNPSSRTQDQEYCRYEIQYLSPNTSTSGILVQDVMQFMPENSSSSSGSSPQKTTATITFGYELVLVLLVFFLLFVFLVLCFSVLVLMTMRALMIVRRRGSTTT
jgi:hypothetical protein